MPIVEESHTVDPEILKSFTPKSELNPDIWTADHKLRPEIREDMLNIAQEFWSSLLIGIPLEDIQFTGSLANYGWSVYSDADVHCLGNMSNIPGPPDLIQDYLQAKKNLWNRKHDITIKGFPVEIYAQDSSSSEATISTGVYSVLHDAWVVEPKPEDVRIDRKAVRRKAEALMSEIDEIIEEGDTTRVEEFMSKLKRLRKAGLVEGGEYSRENLAFKTLRRNGYLQKLSDFESQTYDQQRSLT